MSEENPFTEKEIALQWIKSVEEEKGLIRDAEIYPALASWFQRSLKGVVLDIGSGQGICSVKIEGYEKYIGVEPSHFLNERAKELYGFSTRDFVTGDAYNMPVADSFCDSAFSINVWFHLEDIGQASKELFRVLKKGGKFFINTADSDALDVWKRFYVDPVTEGKKLVGEVKVPVNNMSSNTFYMHSNDEIIKALEKAGLSILSVTKLGRFSEKETIFISIEGEK